MDYSTQKSSRQLASELRSQGQGMFILRGGSLTVREGARAKIKGLSMGHISPQGHADFYIDGSLIEVHKPKIFTTCSQVGGGQRGRITHFSKKSRLRLIQLMGKVQKAAIPLFVTLTYPAEYPVDSSTWKRHLDNLSKRMKRRFPACSFLWRLEAQKRGAPHYHLLVWGVDYAHLLIWLPLAWFQVVGSGDIRHFRAGTQVSRSENWRGAMSYVSKYMAKVASDIEGWDYPGRMWGIKFADCIPWASLVRCSITYKQAINLIRALRRYAHIKARDYKSLRVSVGSPDYWFDRFDRL